MSLFFYGIILFCIGLLLGCIISGIFVFLSFSKTNGDARTTAVAPGKTDKQTAVPYTPASTDEKKGLLNNALEETPDNNAAGKGLTLGFRLPNGSEKSVSFGSRRPPLGLGFGADGTTMPYPKSHAESLGIESGWTILSVNEQYVGKSSTDDVKSMIKRALAEQDKPGSLIIGFALPDGTSRIIDFSDKSLPIGVQFSLGRPCLVTSVLPGGHGEQLGVKTNWCVHYVNGKHVSSQNDDMTGFECIKRRLEEKEAADQAKLEARLKGAGTSPLSPTSTP